MVAQDPLAALARACRNQRISFPARAPSHLLFPVPLAEFSDVVVLDDDDTTGIWTAGSATRTDAVPGSSRTIGHERGRFAFRWRVVQHDQRLGCPSAVYVKPVG